MADRFASARSRAETLPGASLAREIAESERELGAGGLIAGGVAFRIFLWLVPFGLVVAALLSFWGAHDRGGLEDASRDLGVGAAATDAAADALQASDRNIGLVLLVGLVTLGWFTLGALRALVLAYALAWQVKPPKLRRPLTAIALFNGVFVLYVAAGIAVAWLHEQVGASAVFSIAVTIAVSIAIVLGAMWLLPRRATHPRELLPGAVLVAVGVQLLEIVVVLYFAPRLGRSEETYGAFGAAATMLVWLYVISRLITGAAFLNATLWSRRQADVRDTAARPA